MRSGFSEKFGKRSKGSMLEIIFSLRAVRGEVVGHLFGWTCLCVLTTAIVLPIMYRKPELGSIVRRRVMGAILSGWLVHGVFFAFAIRRFATWELLNTVHLTRAEHYQLAEAFISVIAKLLAASSFSLILVTLFSIRAAFLTLPITPATSQSAREISEP